MALFYFSLKADLRKIFSLISLLACDHLYNLSRVERDLVVIRKDRFLMSFVLLICVRMQS